MKSLSGKLKTILVVIGLAIVVNGEGWGMHWKYYGENEEGLYFYQTESITRPSKNIVRVCVKSVYTEKGISYWMRGGGKAFQNLDFSLVLSQLNCTERVMSHLRILFYSKNGEVFYPINNEEWQLFAPDPMSEALYEEICK